MCLLLYKEKLDVAVAILMDVFSHGPCVILGTVGSLGVSREPKVGKQFKKNWFEFTII